MKNKSFFVCNSCGTVYNRWSGKCDACGSWDTITEETSTQSGFTRANPKTSGKRDKIEFVELGSETSDNIRISTGISELDRVLGGGLVEGSAILIGGDPGIGKSTLLLQLVMSLSKQGTDCYYISGEESINQIQLRAKRLTDKLSGEVKLATATSVTDILKVFDKDKESKHTKRLVVIDSIQTMFLEAIESAPGTVSQVRASAHELIQRAKQTGTSLLIVGHVTKDGQIAGPRVLEHMVDTVLYFEGERGHQFRILRTVKNRFGGTDEIGVFEMTGNGLIEILNPSSIFLAKRDELVSGVSVLAAMEGTRPLMVEVQALVAPSYLASPRRTVVGWDSNRLAMILAVLEARCGVSLSNKEVYLTIAGGFKITEPAADLAVAAAIISAISNNPVPENSVFFGEIGLSGEIRAVARADTRIKEAEKLGFSSAFVPDSAKNQTSGKINVKQISHLKQIC